MSDDANRIHDENIYRSTAFYEYEISITKSSNDNTEFSLQG